MEKLFSLVVVVRTFSGVVVTRIPCDLYPNSISFLLALVRVHNCGVVLELVP